MSSRVAAIDCGTNSIRLLIAEREGSALFDVVREMRVVRLGEGVDTSGALLPEAIERTRLALAEYVAMIAEHEVQAIRMVATSASRDASNASAFEAMVLATLGQAPEVITGDQEARLSFDGATRGLRGELPLPTLVVDIGGGSTEFVLGGDRVIAARSVDIGCVRMTERHLVGDPPTDDQIARAVADIDAAIALASETVPFADAHSLVGVAGSVTTVAGIALELEAYDSDLIHGSVISRSRVDSITHQLLLSTRAVRAGIAVMHPGRVDVIGGGALVLSRIMHFMDVDEVWVSESDILDGIAWSLAA